MSYAVRHEGSPSWVNELSAAEVTAALRDGRWEPTDEVRDDSAMRWTALEDHPQFAEAASEVEPPPRKEHPDETRLDMNPLIDVALVLLIFFILTTTYESIRKVLDLPGSPSKVAGQLKHVTEKDVKELFVKVTIRQEAGQPVVKVEDRTVRLDELDAAVARAVVISKKTTLMIDADPDVDYGVVIAVLDAARGAGVAKTVFAKKPPPIAGAAGSSR
jgi:biopolymer transport protein ExbD